MVNSSNHLKQNIRRSGVLITALAAALSLAACGGGADGSEQAASSSSPAQTSSSSSSSAPAKKAVDAKTAAWLKQSDHLLLTLEKDYKALCEQDDRYADKAHPSLEIRQGYVAKANAVINDANALQKLKPFNKTTKDAADYYGVALGPFKEFAQMYLNIFSKSYDVSTNWHLRSQGEDVEEQLDYLVEAAFHRVDPDLKRLD